MEVELPTKKTKHLEEGGEAAHSFQGNTAWTREEKEQSSRSRGKVQ